MLDEVDLQILQVLQSNSRISFSELGRSVGLSATAARNRINSLVTRGIITKLGTELDWEKIGWPIQSLLLIRTEHGKAEAVTKQLQKIARYQTKHYMGTMKIIDIDKASEMPRPG